MPTRKDLDTVATYLADAAWRQMETDGETDESVIRAHYLYVVTVGVAFAKLNNNFNAAKWIAATVPGSWRTERYHNMAMAAIKSIEAGSVGMFMKFGVEV